MTEALKQALDVLANKAEKATTAHEAMQFAQAALNLAHAAVMQHNIMRQP